MNPEIFISSTGQENKFSMLTLGLYINWKVCGSVLNCHRNSFKVWSSHFILCHNSEIAHVWKPGANLCKRTWNTLAFRWQIFRSCETENSHVMINTHATNCTKDDVRAAFYLCWFHSLFMAFCGVISINIKRKNNRCSFSTQKQQTSHNMQVGFISQSIEI